MKYNNQIFLNEFKNKMLEINPQKVLLSARRIMTDMVTVKPLMKLILKV